MQYGIYGCCFPCTWATCNHQNPSCHRFQHSKTLFFCQYDTCLLFHCHNFFCHFFYIGFFIHLRQLQQPFCNSHFRIVIKIQINTLHAPQCFLPHITCHLQFSNGIFHIITMQTQKLCCLLYEFSFWQITISIICGLIEYIFDCRFDTIWIFFCNACICCHFICHTKANPPNIICQTIGICFDNIKCTSFVFFIYFHCICRRNIKFLQKQHGFS